MSTLQKPSVAVLLGTYNGASWVQQQVQSVIGQSGVAVRLFVSDDQSTDGTPEIARAACPPGAFDFLPALPARLGSAGANFRRLIRDAGESDFDYFAFCDQDDIWLDNRLINAISALQDQRAEGYSSSVSAFWTNGRKRLVNNSHPQTDLDYFGGGPGQGCTFVLTRRAIQLVRGALLAAPQATEAFQYHDWLTYALVRSRRLRWIISPQPTVLYRQHRQNDIGARGTLAAMRLRHRGISSGWYGNQLRALLTALESVNGPDDSASVARKVLSRSKTQDRVAHMSAASRFRRSPFDSAAFVAYYLAGKIAIPAQA